MKSVTNGKLLVDMDRLFEFVTISAQSDGESQFFSHLSLSFRSYNAI